MRRHYTDTGLPIYEWCEHPRILRRCHQAKRGEFWYVLCGPDSRLILVTWPWSQTWVAAGDLREGDQWVRVYTSPVPLEIMRMRKLAPSPLATIRPPLPGISKMLAKLPRVLEFLSSTAYDDGAPRVPGYITLRNRGHCYEITAYDPDSGLRLAVGGPEIDHVYTTLDSLLGATDAPWCVDDYLTRQLRGKKKK